MCAAIPSGCGKGAKEECWCSGTRMAPCKDDTPMELAQVRETLPSGECLGGSSCGGWLGDRIGMISGRVVGGLLVEA